LPQADPTRGGPADRAALRRLGGTVRVGARDVASRDYQRYFDAFIDPDQNQYLKESYLGDDFAVDLQQYIRTSLTTVATSKIPERTINNRAGLILNMEGADVLGYLEGLAQMTLSPTDVKAMNILVK